MTHYINRDDDDDAKMSYPLGDGESVVGVGSAGTAIDATIGANLATVAAIVASVAAFSVVGVAAAAAAVVAAAVVEVRLASTHEQQMIAPGFQILMTNNYPFYLLP